MRDRGQPLRAEGVDEGVDLLLGEDRGHEDDGRTGVEERLAALDRVGEHLAAVAVAALGEGVGAGVQHEVGHALGGRGGHHGLDLGGGLGQRLHLVLEVGSDHADADRAADGVGRVAVPALEVGADGQATCSPRSGGTCRSSPSTGIFSPSG